MTNIESPSYKDLKKNLYIFVFIAVRGETRTRTSILAASVAGIGQRPNGRNSYWYQALLVDYSHPR